MEITEIERELENLLFLFEVHMAAQHGIVLAQLDAIGRVALILGGVIVIGALGALELDLNPGSCFSHGSIPFSTFTSGSRKDRRRSA